MIDAEKYVKSFKYKSPFTGELLELHCRYDEYQAGGIFLQLMEKTPDGYMEPYSTASICVPFLADDEIAIKDYSENSDILDELLKNNVVTAPHRHIRSGYVSIPVCRLKKIA